MAKQRLCYLRSKRRINPHFIEPEQFRVFAVMSVEQFDDLVAQCVPMIGVQDDSRVPVMTDLRRMNRKERLGFLSSQIMGLTEGIEVETATCRRKHAGKRSRGVKCLERIKPRQPL